MPFVIRFNERGAKSYLRVVAKSFSKAKRSKVATIGEATTWRMKGHAKAALHACAVGYGGRPDLSFVGNAQIIEVELAVVRVVEHVQVGTRKGRRAIVTV